MWEAGGGGGGGGDVSGQGAVRWLSCEEADGLSSLPHGTPCSQAQPSVPPPAHSTSLHAELLGRAEAGVGADGEASDEAGAREGGGGWPGDGKVAGDEAGEMEEAGNEADWSCSLVGQSAPAEGSVGSMNQ